MSMLDTSVVVELIRRGEFRTGSISIFTVIETLRGVDPDKRIRVKNLMEKAFKVIGLDNRVLETYCEIYWSLRRRGELIPDVDLLIAATAMAYNLTLETKDRHFQRLKPLGLKVKFL